MSTKEKNLGMLATGLMFVAIPIIYNNYKNKQQASNKNQRILLSSSSNDLSGLIRPPFPQAIREMLSKCRLAYLSTVDGDSAHLSLMRFTYLKDEEDGEVVILSTQRKTKKYDMLLKQNGVALLVHDFPQFSPQSSGSDNESGGVHSITLNGQCGILEDGSDKAEKYRQAHLKHNPEYPQFIVGEDIAVLCIIVTSARICNINDRVTKWSVEGTV